MGVKLEPVMRKEGEKQNVSLYHSEQTQDTKVSPLEEPIASFTIDALEHKWNKITIKVTRLKIPFQV